MLSRNKLVILMLVLAGCGPGRYARRRANDLGDVFRFHVGAGPSLGLLANVNATRFVAVGAGEYNTTRYGAVHGRYGSWREERADFNLGVPIYGHTHVTRIYGGNMRRTRSVETFTPSVKYSIHDSTRGLAEVSANVYAGIVGIDTGIDLGELGDFLLGFACIDFLSDDDRTALDASISGSAWMRAEAARKLGNEPGPASEEALGLLINDPLVEVRIRAVRSLGRIGNELTLPVIARAVDDEDGAVREEARKAIEKITDRRFLDFDDLRGWLKEQAWYTKSQENEPPK